jgi:hypothetical protein
MFPLSMSIGKIDPMYPTFCIQVVVMGGASDELCC